MSDKENFEQQVERNYRFNLVMNVMDGASFWFGYSFMAPGIILPLYVSHFSTNPMLIGLVAIISNTGYFLPQLFTARWVQSLPVKKYAPVNIGFFTERVPIILLGPAVLLLANQPTLALVAFFLLFAWHSYGAGFVGVGWNDMLAKVIPLRRRGMFFGVTNALGAGTGVAGAAVAAYLLDKLTFPKGYAASFGLAAVFVTLSWVFLSQVREPAQASEASTATQREYWRGLLSVLRGDRNFQSFIKCQAVITLGGMGWGFAAVYVMQRWSLPDGQVGMFTSAMLIGQTIANLAFGALGDRKGYKAVLEVGTLCAGLGMLLAVIAPHPLVFIAVFAMRGASNAGGFMAQLIAMEFSKPEIRPTYIGLNNTFNGISNVIAPLVGGWLASVLDYRALFIASVVITLLGWAALRWGVHEPRHLQITERVEEARPV